MNDFVFVPYLGISPGPLNGEVLKCCFNICHIFTTTAELDN